MTILGLQDVCGNWLRGLVNLWEVLTSTTYSVLYSVFGDSWDVVFQGIRSIFPDFAEYLNNDSMLMFMLSTGLTFYIAWSLATWLLNLVT